MKFKANVEELKRLRGKVETLRLLVVEEGKFCTFKEYRADTGKDVDITGNLNHPRS